MQISRSALTELSRIETWLPWAFRGLRVILIFAGAWILAGITRRLLKRMRPHLLRMMTRHGKSTAFEQENRVQTILAMFRKLAGILIWLSALVMALNELTFNIGPLVAGLGVAGLAFGLGAQSLIKDLLGGLFMLLEDQIRIGDSVTINGTSGSVEEINLRTTVLRSENGTVHIIPNGSVNMLSNATRDYSYYVFETTLAHRADADRALQILRETAEELAQEEAFRLLILAPVQIMGIDKLGERGSVLKARIKTVPTKDAEVGREMNRRVKAKLDAADINFPPPPFTAPPLSAPPPSAPPPSAPPRNP
ncbi:MAG TPA: mechanosensitive ion channel family protein [Bryobacteraceae bacterium]|nr:mechanosensitive ion channel family protein [Bryobacteraceae bacterium]